MSLQNKPGEKIKLGITVATIIILTACGQQGVPGFLVECKGQQVHVAPVRRDAEPVEVIQKHGRSLGLSISRIDPEHLWGDFRSSRCC